MFIKQVFDADDGEEIDLFCCVVAENNRVGIVEDTKYLS